MLHTIPNSLLFCLIFLGSDIAAGSQQTMTATCLDRNNSNFIFHLLFDLPLPRINASGCRSRYSAQTLIDRAAACSSLRVRSNCRRSSEPFPVSAAMLANALPTSLIAGRAASAAPVIAAAVFFILAANGSICLLTLTTSSSACPIAAVAEPRRGSTWS